MGDPRFNMHPGHIVWSSLALYIHNSACSILKKSNPSFRDEDLFQRSRTILFHIVQKIRLQDFVSDSVAHTRDELRLVYDPPLLRKHLADHFGFSGGKKPNFIEFNHVYQAWHALIPDTVNFEGGNNLTLRELMWNPAHFTNASFIDFAKAFTITPIGRYGPHNFPHFVRVATEQAIANSHAQRMAGYNDYRRYFGLPPLTDFDKFSVDDSAVFANLYSGDIERVEFLTGVVADSRPELPGNVLGDVQLIMVALLALQDLASSAVILNPRLYSAEYLTEDGLSYVKTFEFREILSQIVRDTNVADDCPMHLPGSCPHRPSSWAEPEEVPARFMDQSRMCSFIGANLNEWFFFDGGYGFSFVVVLQLSMGLVVVLYTIVFHTVRNLLLPKESDPQDIVDHGVGRQNIPLPSITACEQAPQNKVSATSTEGHPEAASLLVRICSLNTNFLLSFCLFIPASWFWFRLVSDQGWVQYLFESGHVIALWTTALCSVSCLAEVTLRLNSGAGSRSFVLLTVHHVVVFLLVILTATSADVAVFKLSVTLLTAWTWEWTLFLSFLGARVFDAIERCWEKPCKGMYVVFIKFGLPVLAVLYFATRLIAIVAATQIVVCGFQRNLHRDINVRGGFLIASILTTVAVALQIHAGFAILVLRRRRLAKLNTRSSRATIETEPSAGSGPEAAPMRPPLHGPPVESATAYI